MLESVSGKPNRPQRRRRRPLACCWVVSPQATGAARASHLLQPANLPIISSDHQTCDVYPPNWPQKTWKRCCMRSSCSATAALPNTFSVLSADGWSAEQHLLVSGGDKEVEKTDKCNVQPLESSAPAGTQSAPELPTLHRGHARSTEDLQMMGRVHFTQAFKKLRGPRGTTHE